MASVGRPRCSGLSDFHNSPEWITLARLHKSTAKHYGQFKCVECGSTKDLQSDHILPFKHLPGLGLYLWNLCIRCRYCNAKKGTKIYFDWITIKACWKVIKLCFRAVVYRGILVTILTTGVYYGFSVYLE